MGPSRAGIARNRRQFGLHLLAVYLLCGCGSQGTDARAGDEPASDQRRSREEIGTEGSTDLGTPCGPTGFYLVSGEPAEDIEPNRPFPTRVHCIDADDRLVELWSTDRPTQFIRLYMDPGLLVLGMGQAQLEELRLVPLPDLKDERAVHLGAVRGLVGVRAVMVDGEIGFELSRLEAQAGRIVTEFVDPESGKISPLRSAGAVRERGRTLFAGSGRSQDVGLVRLGPDGRFLSNVGPSLELPTTPVPEPLRPPEARRGWNVVATTTAFFAAKEIIHTKGQKEATLLVFDRKSDAWSTYTVEGGESRIRPMGGWLVGEVVHSHPDTDPSRSLGFPPIPSSRVVLIDPAHKRTLVFDLGDDPELLWLGDAMLLYRRGSDLYRTHFDGEDLSAEDKWLSSPVIRHMHWAFRQLTRVNHDSATTESQGTTPNHEARNDQTDG